MPNEFFSRKNIENLEKMPHMPTEEELESSIEDPKNIVINLIGHLVNNSMLAFKIDIDNKKFDNKAMMRLLVLAIKALKNVLYKVGEETGVTKEEIDAVIEDDSDGGMRFI